MTKKSDNERNVAKQKQKLKVKRETARISRYFSTKRKMGTSELPTEATNSVTGAAGPNSMKLQQQTTGIIPSSSLPEPMIITSEPSSTTTNFGSSHQMTAAEKAEDEFLASIVIPEPVHFKEITEDDVIKKGWFVTPGEVRVSKGRTMTQMFCDAVEELCAKYPLPPDYDSDAEWGEGEGECCGGINHLANEQTDMQDWFRERMASSAPTR